MLHQKMKFLVQKSSLRTDVHVAHDFPSTRSTITTMEQEEYSILHPRIIGR